MEKLPKKLLPFVTHFLKKQKLRFIISQLGAFSWTIDHTLFPVVFMYIIDTLTNHMDDRANIFTYLAPILIAGALLWIIVEFGFRISGIMLSKALPTLEAQVRMAMFNYVQHHSYNYFSNEFAGSLANKINDMPQSITRILQLIISLFIPAALAVLISTALFAFVNPLFALILFAWVILHLSVCFGFSKKSDYLSHLHAEARSVLSGKIVDSLSNHLNVKLFARFREEYRYVDNYQEIEKNKYWEALWFNEKIKIILGILSFLLPGILLTALMLISWQKGYLSNGEVIFVLNSSWNIMIMVTLSGLELPNLFKEIGVANQALTIIQSPHDIVDAPGAKDLVVTQGKIEFDHVTFHHTAGKALFQDKSLEINPGEKIGLVGLSGSGKTSFIQLILRHFEVEKGRILIDGQDIAKVTLNSLRRAIAMIPQEPLLFHRSLMENIRYGKLDATDEEVFEASRKAHCDEFIIKMPEGYKTLVGERGVKLSGGQRQRIAIARAILKNASILILDEATSALDSVTEQHIQEDLKDLMQGRTTIVIAHRLSTISHMDRILVFENGEVIEEGTHEELLMQNGRYADMWKMQAGGFLVSGDQEEFYEDEETYDL